MPQTESPMHLHTRGRSSCYGIRIPESVGKGKWAPVGGPAPTDLSRAGYLMVRVPMLPGFVSANTERLAMSAPTFV